MNIDNLRLFKILRGKKVVSTISAIILMGSLTACTNGSSGNVPNNLEIPIETGIQENTELQQQNKILEKSAEENSNVNNNSNELLNETYDYIGDEFKSKTGDTYRTISQSKNGEWLKGIYNVTKNRIDIPCDYILIGDEFKSETGDIYRKITQSKNGQNFEVIYDVTNSRVYSSEYKEVEENDIDEKALKKTK